MEGIVASLPQQKSPEKEREERVGGEEGGAIVKNQGSKTKSYCFKLKTQERQGKEKTNKHRDKKKERTKNQIL